MYLFFQSENCCICNFQKGYFYLILLDIVSLLITLYYLLFAVSYVAEF